MPKDLAEFETRCEKHDGFSLYDQQDSCQFLDKNNLCRLHDAGVKPSECYWWPYHVYEEKDGSLSIRLSTSCCEGYKSVGSGVAFIATVENQARSIGGSLLRKFRQTYHGSYQTTHAATLDF